jgi:hypothetical protein
MMDLQIAVSQGCLMLSLIFISFIVAPALIPLAVRPRVIRVKAQSKF